MYLYFQEDLKEIMQIIAQRSKDMAIIMKVICE